MFHMKIVREKLQNALSPHFSNLAGKKVLFGTIIVPMLLLGSKNYTTTEYEIHWHTQQANCIGR